MDLLGPIHKYGSDYWLMKYAKKWGLDIDLDDRTQPSEVNNGEEEKEKDE